MTRSLAIALAFLFLPGPAVTAAAGAGAGKLRVLMIGNSYTAMTRGELKAFLGADPAIDAELVAHCPGGRTLSDHASNPKVAKLLGPDNFHPGKLGAFLAGAVLYEAITGKPATGIPYDGGLDRKLGDTNVAAALKTCAHETSSRR